jgi:hypothetical protein
MRTLAIITETAKEAAEKPLPSPAAPKAPKKPKAKRQASKKDPPAT